jgi:hypothetical protein
MIREQGAAEMDDDPYDLMGDAADEARDDYYRARVEEESGEEIRDSVDRRELLQLMLLKHVDDWPKVERELAKASKRLKDGEYEEAIYHASRAFDGYVDGVFIGPIRRQIVGKFERLLPNVTADGVLKQVNGMTGGSTFTSYAMSAAVEDEASAQALVAQFRDFIGSRDKYGVWQLRNALFHTTENTDAGRATSFLRAATDLLVEMSAPFRAMAEERERRREAEYSSAPHIAVLQILAPVFEGDKSASLDVFEWPKPSGCSMSEVHSELYTMLGDGFVERTHGGLDEQWRLTPKGYGHWKREVEPKRNDRGR